ncbi:MAG TPA: YceI family protein [Tepidisphaeraceae bacterium]|nr:YceI family protein [Tepidisphaeraceae bacterium]
MSVRRLSAMVALMIGLLLANRSAIAADTYSIDPVHSNTIFRIHHFNAGYVYGFIALPTGSFVYDDSDPTNMSFTVSASLDNLDTANSRRDSDLKGPDWFNAKQFPTIDFKSTSVKKTGDTTYDVTGDLTVHGVTKSVTVPMEMTGTGQGMRGETRMGFETTFTIQRADFDMAAMPGAVGSDVRIIVALEGIKQ